MKPSNLFPELKTDAEKLSILIKAHLSLPKLDIDYFPDDLCEKRRELEQLMLKYIWKWSKKQNKAKKIK